RHCSVRLVICFDLAIDQIAQSGLSSLKVIYYSAQLFSAVNFLINLLFGCPLGNVIAISCCDATVLPNWQILANF
ncbi:hypothetical protein, partial [Shigella sonnei]